MANFPRYLAPSLLVTFLAGCTTQPTVSPPPIGKLVVEFQGGQTATINLDKKGADYRLNSAVATWAKQGYYNGQFVYRQVPGYFLLAGKARLNGHVPEQGISYVGLQADGTMAELPEAHMGQVGAVVHANGTVGPELMLQYGWSLADEGTEPQNIRIGTLEEGKGNLKSVQRGDKIWRITFQPAPPQAVGPMSSPYR